MITKKTSKELLADSLSELLQSEPFEKITITRITANCGVAKRTFYYYFKDKYDLALWLYIHQLDRFREGEKKVTFHSFLLHSANILWKDRFLVQNILQYSGQNNFRQSVYAPMAERCLSIIEQDYGDEITPELREAVTFFVGGMITYAERGLAEREPPPPETAVPVFEACIPQPLKKYLDNPAKE